MEKMRNDKADLGWSMTTVLSDPAGANTWKGQTDKPLLSPATRTCGSGGARRLRYP
jgi:hypothetical protein